MSIMAMVNLIADYASIRRVDADAACAHIGAAMGEDYSGIAPGVSARLERRAADVAAEKAYWDSRLAWVEGEVK